MKVGLFIPCYVDAVFPEVGMACYKLLRHLGLDVVKSGKSLGRFPHKVSLHNSCHGVRELGLS